MAVHIEMLPWFQKLNFMTQYKLYGTYLSFEGKRSSKSKLQTQLWRDGIKMVITNFDQEEESLLTALTSRKNHG